MATANATAYDLQYYYADLKRYPCLSNAEVQALLASIPASEVQSSPPTARVLRAKQRLIEMHLWAALHAAVQVCPKQWYATRLPDLVQVANLALVRAVERYDWTGNVTKYVLAWVEGEVKSWLIHDRFVKTPYHAYKRAERLGTLDALSTMQPISLDRLLDDADADSDLHKMIEAPPPEPAPQQREQKRAQVDMLLSYLSPRAQTILRLRYGLYYEDDTRPRTYREIAAELGMSLSAVENALHHAHARLQALVSGQASLTQRYGRVCISLRKRTPQEGMRPKVH
jgi:RNA polymerase sigma factor (sigma-70 family)